MPFFYDNFQFYNLNDKSDNEIADSKSVPERCTKEMLLEFASQKFSPFKMQIANCKLQIAD